MKQKHEDAMIAMGIKIAALEMLQRNHGEAHQAQDILPQFRELCEKVTGINDRLVMESRARCEQNRSIYNLNAAHDCQQTTNDSVFTRIREADEAIAALWEAGTEQDAGIASMLAAVPEIEILKTQVKALEERLSRAQDMIAEIHPSGCLIIRDEPKRTCESCDHRSKGLNKFHCDLVGVKMCFELSQWEPKKTSGRSRKVK